MNILTPVKLNALTFPFAPISKDADVELVFYLNDGTKETKYQLHAKVVRVADEGIGLKFHDFDTSVFRSLQELINYKGQELVH